MTPSLFRFHADDVDDDPSSTRSKLEDVKDKGLNIVPDYGKHNVHASLREHSEASLPTPIQEIAGKNDARLNCCGIL